MNKLHKPVCNIEVDNREAQQQHNDEGSEFEADFRGSMFRVGITCLQMPIVAMVTVEVKDLEMEVDTSAAVSENNHPQTNVP